MNIDPLVAGSLRALLDKIDALSADRNVAAAKVSEVSGAAARLQKQIADFDAKLNQLSNLRIAVEPDRLAQIIAGKAVQQAEGTEIESRAAEARQVKAHRLQSTEDLAALVEHLSGLNASVVAIDARIARLEARFYNGLGEAVLAAYKRNALAFVEDNVPYLRSIAHRVRAATGEGPDWEKRVLFSGALQVQWLEEEPTQETPHHVPVHAPVQVWPRPTHNLLSGRPIISDGVIDELIRQLRAGAAANLEPPKGTAA